MIGKDDTRVRFAIEDLPPRAITCRGGCGVEVPSREEPCAACAPRLERIIQDRARQALRSVPPMFRWAHFDAPELPLRVRPACAIDAARGATSHSVVLVGPAGAGKTSLAVAMLQARAFERLKRGRDLLWRYLEDHSGMIPERGRFITTFDLVRAKAEHRLGQSEPKVINDAAHDPVLVIDELGSEQSTSTIVAEVIHSRHAHERMTIFTSPYDTAAIAGKYGDGIARRVFERATVIRLGGR